MRKILFWSVMAMFAAKAVAAFAADKPNFLFLVSDDQDWTGLSVQMHPGIPTAKSDWKPASRP